jgi:hypothetical protein
MLQPSGRTSVSNNVRRDCANLQTGGQANLLAPLSLAVIRAESAKISNE